MKYQEIASPQQKVLLLMLQKECSKDLRSSRLLRSFQRLNDAVRALRVFLEL